MPQRFNKTIVKLNGQTIVVDNVDIDQSANLKSPFKLDNYVSTDSVIDGPITSSLRLQYLLTGKDYLKDFISTKPEQKISGYVAGLYFNYGFLDNYNVSITPNQPISVNASITIFDEITGVIVDTPPFNIQQVKSLNASNIVYSVNNSEVAIDNISSIKWNYQTNFQPSYNYRDSGMNRFLPDTVSIGEKTIDVEISCDDTALALPLSGHDLSFDIFCYNESNTGINERFACSGKINRKTFSNSVGNTSNTVYVLRQSHINNIPIITSIDTSLYNTQRAIIIYATGNENGYLTSNKMPIVDRVFVGDSECTFNVADNVNNQAITGVLPLDAINGILSIQTTKGTVNYPSGLTLPHPVVVISGFYPVTGKQNDQILISGVNFYRISNVKFGDSNSNFEVVSTGSTHFIKATVPANASAGNIVVSSLLRNNSGISPRVFFPLMQIYSINPATGTFGATITLSGLNFSGVTGVYFNNIKSPSFNIVSNTTLTAITPPTGSGYVGGYITMYGTGGMMTASNNYYLPSVSITGIRTNPVELTIDLDKFDAQYLHPFQGGYKVRVDYDLYGFSRFGGTNSITGLIGGSSRYPKISIYRPDGITTYPNYTGVYTQIGPAPSLSRLNYEGNWNTLGNNFGVYKHGVHNVKVEGLYFRDFYSKPWFSILRHNLDKNLYNPVNSFSSYLSDTEATIEFAVTGRTGYYDLIVQNFVGSGIFTGAFLIYNPEPISIKCTASQFPTVHLYTNGNLTTEDAMPASLAIDQYTFFPYTTNNINNKKIYPHILDALGSQDNTRSAYYVYTTVSNSGAWWQMELKPEFMNKRYDVREIYVSMHHILRDPTKNIITFSNGVSQSPMYTTFVTIYNTSDVPVYNTFADFDLTYGNLTPKGMLIWSGISSPITGFKKIVVYVKAQAGLVADRLVALNGVELY